MKPSRPSAGARNKVIRPTPGATQQQAQRHATCNLQLEIERLRGRALKHSVCLEGDPVGQQITEGMSSLSGEKAAM